MTDYLKAVAKVVALNGNELIGKTRFQKSVYFLERYDVGFGFHYDYHYYGPYSEELSVASSDAGILNYVKVAEGLTESSNKYVIFNEPIDVSVEDHDTKRSLILEKLKRYNSVELELAATADFLELNGFPQDFWAETKRRKNAKAAPERIESAKELLADIRSVCV